MDTRTVGALRILKPDLDPRDLDPVADAPDDEDLTEAFVEDRDWAGLHLTGARISRSRLVAVDLSQARWRNVRLYECRFERVDLSNARLVGATVERCEFVGCRMTGLQLVESTLKNVVFEDCRIDYASLVRVAASGPAAWVGCQLSNTVLVDCRLPTAAVADCRAADLQLKECDLRGTDLRGTPLGELTGLGSLRGATIDSGQLPDLAALAVKDLELRLAD